MSGYDKDSGGGSGGPDGPGSAHEPRPVSEPSASAERGTAWGAKPGPPAMDPGPKPVLNPDPAPDPGLNPASDPGLNPNPNPGLNPAPDPGLNPNPNPGANPNPAPHPANAPDPFPPPRTGIAGLKPGYQVVAACALALIAVAACLHVAFLFLHVAPSNTATKQHGDVVDGWIYPEFEQNWKLFAPNPLQQNVAVQARAELDAAEGGVRTTDWYDLSAQDGARIDGNLLPSHTQQNELRRAWDFYVGSHDTQNRPIGLRGQLSESYVRRIAYMRLDRERPGGEGDRIVRVQVRSKTTNVRPPKWSEEKVSAKPVYRQLPWWTVAPGDLPLSDAAGRGDAADDERVDAKGGGR
ncbi:hypothetical protein SALBM135S_05471 [Streptomyces alboniger]